MLPHDLLLRCSTNKMIFRTLLLLFILVDTVGCKKNEEILDYQPVNEEWAVEGTLAISEEQLQHLKDESENYQQVQIVVEDDNTLTVDGNINVSNEELVSLLEKEGAKEKTVLILARKNAAAIQVIRTIDIAKDSGIEIITIASEVTDE